MQRFLYFLFTNILLTTKQNRLLLEGEHAMAILSTKVILPCSIQEAWDLVTTVEKYTWRSDLSKTEKINERQFVEYTKDGYVTNFTITKSEPYKRWEFDMKNGSMTGHWGGIFTEKGEQTEIDFTEDVTVKKPVMKPFVKVFLKKQQELYVSDLKKAL